MGKRKKQLEEKDRQVYLEGLKKYQDRGIPVYIDNKEASEEDMGKIFEIQEDGSFYMGDYVGADSGCLREIRFDKVYNK
ncbi:hypothetical protein [Clostridium sp. AM58-1XD]|uniref:hypothetical protein n=1 Tax=Clostridium sp. AM58-1XD TaxID=2292307 RepID=UPI000E50EF31|nr:hypothetical protein [Clostridium sp. AM58-1XD]RGZ01246.1 hypothetical protein DXA13_02585 [Clostridium sp. AM58-1XD]